MLNPNEIIFLKEFYMAIKDFLIGFLGGLFSYIVPYYKNYNKGQVFLLGMFVTKALLGGFVGWLIGGSLDQDVIFRDLWIAFGGVSAFVFISAIDREFIVQILEIWLGRMKGGK